MLVAGLLVVVVLKSWLVCFLFFVMLFWGGGSKNNNGVADFVSRGGRDNNIFWKGGVQKTTTGLQFLSLGCGRGSK